MLRLLIGAALLPLSASLAWAAAKTLAGVAVGSSTAAPFAAGLGLAFAGWAMSRWLFLDPVGPAGWAPRLTRWCHVLAHELTHAMAAWATGGSVYAISVGEKEGHVDLSHSNAFVALAPYCVPFYALAVAVGYRLLLWSRPDAGGESLFLLLLGAALGGHLLFTWDSLTQTRQPDLDAAGGVLFSLSLIACANSLMLLILLKALFPQAVPLLARLKEAGSLTGRFWTFAWVSGGRPALAAAKSRALAW
ncbi:MAG: hypothetical protein M0D55_04235 [Elusimicrobiota bacterium]|nr:MAG: hypothetical protein M0D55_04235 [Elusimicrobiota bacterium]